MPIKLLLIEDEAAIRQMIRFSLPENEFYLEEAENVKQAEIALLKTMPDLILVDWMLPGKSGIDFIQWLRKHSLYEGIPVILLTAKAEEQNKIKGLTQGADDYMTKPFSPAELVARIKTILRRGKILKSNEIIQQGRFAVDDARKQITIDSKLLDLRPIEYKILYFFITHPGKVFSREQLLDFIWGIANYVDERTVDVNIRRVRDKLKLFQAHNEIKTVRGSGYIFGSDHE